MEMNNKRKHINCYRRLPAWFPKDLLPFVDKRIMTGLSIPEHKGGYKPDESIPARYFFSHHLLDTMACSEGSKRRFNEKGVRRYLVEKFAEEPWVAAGNSRLSEKLEAYLEQNLCRMEQLQEIRVLDFGPSGGALTTLFALRALERYGLLEKARLYLLDIVPQVIEMTINGDFVFPEAIQGYGLGFAGKGGSIFKQMLSEATPIVGDFHEYTPQEKFHIILNGYTIHHLNIFDKQDCAEFMERNLEQKGAIAIVDFFVRSFEEYKEWLVGHLKANPDSPAPVESPYFGREQIQGFFSLPVLEKDDNLEHSWAMVISNGNNDR